MNKGKRWGFFCFSHAGSLAWFEEKRRAKSFQFISTIIYYVAGSVVMDGRLLQ